MFYPNLTQGDVDQIRDALAFSGEFRAFVEDFKEEEPRAAVEMSKAFFWVEKAEGHLAKMGNPVFEMAREVLRPLVSEVKPLIVQ